jgi:hypothetical protein
VWESYRRGRLWVSFGLLTRLTVNERFGVGDLVPAPGGELTATVEVLGPSWVTADRVELFANGIKVREQSIRATREPLKARVTWTMPRPVHDVHLVVIATGPGVTAPYWETPRPYQAASKVFTPRIIGSTNPVWIDADGDGVFTPARGYAARLVTSAGGDPRRLVASLAAYDEPVAVQAADLWRSSGQSAADEALLESLRRAPEFIRRSFAAGAGPAR